MSFNSDDLRKNVVVPSTASTVLTHSVSEVIEDLREIGMHSTETSGLYYKALAVTYEDCIMSFGKFPGEGDILNG